MPDVWKIMSVTVIVLFAAISVGMLLKAFDIKRYWYAIFLLLGLAVAVWGYMLIPSYTLDIFRLNGLVDWMRQSCSTLSDAMRPQEDDIYGSLVFFRILCYGVSRTPSNQWLPWISVMIVFSLTGYMLINYLRSQKYNTRMILPALLVIFMGMQLQYVYSGVRNAVAVTLALMALYLVFYKKRGYVVALVLYLMAVTTHSMVLVLIPVVLVCQLPKAQTAFRIVALCSMPIIFALAELMMQFPVPLLQSTGVRILYYLEWQYLYDRPEMIANIAAFLAIGLTYWVLKCIGSLPPSTQGWKKYMNAYYFLGCMMIGCAVRRDFSLRIGYIMGFAAVPVLCRMLNIGRNRYFSTSERFLLALMGLILLICFGKVYYDTWYVLRQWNFL